MSKIVNFRDRAAVKAAREQRQELESAHEQAKLELASAKAAASQPALVGAVRGKDRAAAVGVVADANARVLEAQAAFEDTQAALSAQRVIEAEAEAQAKEQIGQENHGAYKAAIKRVTEAARELRR